MSIPSTDIPLEFILGMKKASEYLRFKEYQTPFLSGAEWAYRHLFPSSKPTETEKPIGYINSDRYIPMTAGDPDKSDAYLRKLVSEAHNRETELMKKAIIMRDCYNDYISILIKEDRTIEMSAKQREALSKALIPFGSFPSNPRSVQLESIPSSEPATPMAMDIIARAAVYLRDMKFDDVHDPSVGLRRDMELVALVEDVESFLKQAYRQDSEPAKESQTDRADDETFKEASAASYFAVNHCTDERTCDAFIEGYVQGKTAQTKPSEQPQPTK